MMRISLTPQDVAYIVGKKGETRIRLENFSGARLNIGDDTAEIDGSEESRELAALAIKITLQQRNGGRVDVDFAELEEREDVSTLDVPVETVGFLLGAKGATLRSMENKFRTFMFFDNEHLRDGKHGRTKRLYVVGSRASRLDALDEAEDVVRFKLTGESRNGRAPPARFDDRGRDGDFRPRDRAPPPERPRYDRYDDHYDDRYDDRRGPPPPRYDDRYERRSPPRYDDRYDDRRGPPPPRYDDRYERRSPPRYDDRYDDRRGPPPPRYDERERDYRGPPPPRHDDGPRYDERDYRGPPPRSRSRSPPPRY